MELNAASILAAKPGDVLNDVKVRGLSLHCNPTGKSFKLFYRTKSGQQRRPKIGDYGSITLAQARKVAQEMLAEVAAGRDPSASKAEARAEPTLADLWAEYEKVHLAKKKQSGQHEDARQWNAYLNPKFGRTKLSDLTYKKVADMVEGMADTPIQANRLLALLSKMFNVASEKLRWDVQNPTIGVERYPEVKRKRYMNGEEAAVIAELLHSNAADYPASVAFLYLLILTGARCGEIANANWAMVQGTKLVLSDHKTDRTGDDRVIHLPQAALDVLAKLPRDNQTITGIKSPKRFWGRIRIEAGCPDLRMHDLRHSFASAALAAGLSLAQIGELLGHKSAQTTKRYAHLMDEVASAAATATADVIAARMKRAPAVV